MSSVQPDPGAIRSGVSWQSFGARFVGIRWLFSLRNLAQ